MIASTRSAKVPGCNPFSGFIEAKRLKAPYDFFFVSFQSNSPIG